MAVKVDYHTATIRGGVVETISQYVQIRTISESITLHAGSLDDLIEALQAMKVYREESSGGPTGILRPQDMAVVLDTLPVLVENVFTPNIAAVLQRNKNIFLADLLTTPDASHSDPEDGLKMKGLTAPLRKQLKRQYADFMKKHGVDVNYYDDVYDTAFCMCRFFWFQYWTQGGTTYFAYFDERVHQFPTTTDDLWTPGPDCFLYLKGEWTGPYTEYALNRMIDLLPGQRPGKVFR